MVGFLPPHHNPSTTSTPKGEEVVVGGDSSDVVDVFPTTSKPRWERWENTTSRGGWEGGFCHLDHLGGKVVGSR